MISIIGAGRVGSAVAFLAASTAIDDIVLVNRTINKALGESLDITNAVPKGSTISITATDQFSKIKGSRVVIVTISAGKIKEERVDLLPSNVPIIREISKHLSKYAEDAKIVVVTNPVDVITYQILKETEFPSQNVIGMGSSLDSSRFRYLLAKELGVNQADVEGIVLGEHGPTMVPIFSNVKCKSNPFSLDEKKMVKITTELRNYWRYLVEYKGASVFGAAKNTFDIAKAVINDEKLTVSTSVYLDGQYGFRDLCMGMPVVIGRSGAKKMAEIPLNQSERESLEISYTRISENIGMIPNIIS